MTRRYLTLLLFLLLAAPKAAIAQEPQEKIDLETINKIKEEGLKHSQVMEILSYLTDVYGPRLTGSPNIKAGQEWAKQKLNEWGLKNAHLEVWGPFGRGWSLEAFTANLIKPQFSPLIAYPKAWSPSTNGIVRGQAVYLDAKSEAELEKYKGKLKGAIVLIAPPREVKAHFEAEAKRASDERLLELANAEPQPGGPPRRFEMTPEQRAQAELMRKKWELCYSEGAAVVLEPSARGDGGTIFVGAVTYPTPVDLPFDRRPRPWAKDAAPAIPQVVLAVEHYNRLIRLIAKGVRPELELSITSRFHDDDPNGYNVIAEIPGTDLKDEVVMLGAHFDSWHSGTGATDNAAGSAVCLEAVRILQAIAVKPRRTIRIGLWSGEEQGLLGSRAYVEQHFGKRVQPGQGEKVPLLELKPEHSKLAAYFNLDNGTGGIRGVYMQSNEAVRPIFRAWLAPFKVWIPNSRVLSASTLSAANTGGTDHLSFDAVGLPGFQFIQDPIEYDTRTHHSNMDVYDRIQEEDMKQAAIIMASFVYNAAMRDQKLPRKTLPAQASQ
jgi:carboxypeptidase Q